MTNCSRAGNVFLRSNIKYAWKLYFNYFNGSKSLIVRSLSIAIRRTTSVVIFIEKKKTRNNKLYYFFFVNPPFKKCSRFIKLIIVFFLDYFHFKLKFVLSFVVRIHFIIKLNECLLKRRDNNTFSCTREKNVLRLVYLFKCGHTKSGCRYI